MANHWTSTRPGTRFTTLCVASVVLDGGFAALSDRQLTIHSQGVSETRAIEDARDYAQNLRDLFRIALSDEDAERLPPFS